MLPRRLVCVGALVALLSTPSLSEGAVDPDCLDDEYGFACHKGRVADADLADELIAPVLARAGWARGCYRVLYIEGDPGQRDTLLVGVDGPRGGSAPSCQRIDPAKLTAAEARAISDRGGGMREMMKAIADKTITEGKRNSASSAQLKDIGRKIRSAILSADPATRTRLLRNTREIALGSGYGGEAHVPLK